METLLAQLIESNQKILEKLSAAPAPTRQTDQSDSTAALAGALAEAQGKFSNPERTKTAKVRGKTKEGTPYEYEYKYADLADILNVIRAPLSEAGVAIMQDCRFDTESQCAVVVTTLRHKSGEWLRSSLRYPAPVTTRGVQDLGSIFTYLRRYSLSGLISLAPEEDDDGQLAVEATAREPKPAKGNKPEKQPDGMPSQEELDHFWSEWKSLAPARFPSQEEAAAWLKRIDPNPNKANRSKLQALIRKLRAMPVLGKEEPTNPEAENEEQKAQRKAIQQRFMGLLQNRAGKKKMETEHLREVICWWAGEKHGWVRETESYWEKEVGSYYPTRPQASKSPLAAVRAAVEAFAAMTSDELDVLLDDHTHWLNEKLVELNPPGAEEPAEAESVQ